MTAYVIRRAIGVARWLPDRQPDTLTRGEEIMHRDSRKQDRAETLRRKEVRRIKLTGSVK